MQRSNDLINQISVKATHQQNHEPGMAFLRIPSDSDKYRVVSQFEGFDFQCLTEKA